MPRGNGSLPAGPCLVHANQAVIAAEAHSVLAAVVQQHEVGGDGAPGCRHLSGAAAGDGAGEGCGSADGVGRGSGSPLAVAAEPGRPVTAGAGCGSGFRPRPPDGCCGDVPPDASAGAGGDGAVPAGGGACGCGRRHGGAWSRGRARRGTARGDAGRPSQAASHSGSARAAATAARALRRARRPRFLACCTAFPIRLSSGINVTAAARRRRCPCGTGWDKSWSRRTRRQSGVVAEGSGTGPVTPDTAAPGTQRCVPGAAGTARMVRAGR